MNRRCRPLLLLLFLELTVSALGQGESRVSPLAPAPKLARPEAPDNPADPQPCRPLDGQPFDDRDLVLYLESEGRKLFAAGLCPRLATGPRTCELELPEPEKTLPGWPAVAARAAAATLVIGEFYREGKSKKDEFSTAAGGFVIAPSGVCVTCLHVINEKTARGFVAMTRDGRVFAVRAVLAVDPVEDIAILQLDLPAETTLPALSLAAEPATVGTAVGVMSHPDERFFLFTTGTVGRHTVWRETTGTEHFMAITADFGKGSSGCPVLDERGAVVGVVNNTESIYFDDDGKKRQTDLQMVVKNATPSWVVRGLVGAGKRSE